MLLLLLLVAPSFSTLSSSLSLRVGKARVALVGVVVFFTVVVVVTLVGFIVVVGVLVVIRDEVWGVEWL